MKDKVNKDLAYEVDGVSLRKSRKQQHKTVALLCGSNSNNDFYSAAVRIKQVASPDIKGRLIQRTCMVELLTLTREYIPAVTPSNPADHPIMYIPWEVKYSEQ